MFGRKKDSLPAPDTFGNYWLRRAGGKNDVQGPCILRSRFEGLYFASRGEGGGLLVRGPGLDYFTSPEEALASLEAANNGDRR